MLIMLSNPSLFFIIVQSSFNSYLSSPEKFSSTSVCELVTLSLRMRVVIYPFWYDRALCNSRSHCFYTDMPLQYFGVQSPPLPHLTLSETAG